MRLLKLLFVIVFSFLLIGGAFYERLSAEMIRISGRLAADRGPLTAWRNNLWRQTPFGRQYATVTDLRNYPKVGEKLHGFTLQRTKEVPELQMTALQLRHEKTGADYIHLARDDKNNVFSISFKTNPPDATGVPHILEHTTLCGSEKYAQVLKFNDRLLRRSQISCP